MGSRCKKNRQLPGTVRCFMALMSGQASSGGWENPTFSAIVPAGPKERRVVVPRVSFIPVLMREYLANERFPREPEPALVMDDDAQVSAYAEAGRIDGDMAAAYLFHSARISQTIAGAGKVLDLGCGPATQLVQIAQLNPEIEFVGVDLSESMLDSARAYAIQQGVSNIRFEHADITQLGQFETGSFDAVISTMALHHLPHETLLDACCREISRVLKPGGAIYLTDFGRLKSLKSVLFFAYLNAKHQPHLFSLDYERSLRAAFLPEDFARRLEVLSFDARLISTFLVPLLVIVQTPVRTLSAATVRQIKRMRRELVGKYRRDLDDLRLFFWLGGLRDDPFSLPD
ncbi:MAG: class I SAM-dependent methyltransferase [Burkholderiaceae bacterium]|nr:MAG: class I SAM-dependent methyltransferase [Burkholderiaceae bacterium]